MGMFSMGDREINEVNEFRAETHLLHRWQRRQPAKSEIEVALGKLSVREIQILLHYGAEVYMENVREVDAGLADRMEGEMTRAIRTTKQLPHEEQVKAAGRITRRARATMDTLLQSGKL